MYRFPIITAFIGAGGLIPFLWLAIAINNPSMYFHQYALELITSYSAIILSFLGGIHWGLIMPQIFKTSGRNLLLISIIPPIVGWIALALDPMQCLWVLISAFVGEIIVDFLWCKREIIPRWYLKLRIPLTILVCLSLLATMISF